MKTIVRLWEESTIIQGIMGLSCMGVILYLALVGREVPDLLVGLLGTIIGFYFRSKGDQQVRSMVKDISKGKDC